MGNKQSKYSKRKPTNIPEPVRKINAALEAKLKAVMERHYELGIFIDDMRSLDNFAKYPLPKAAEWVSVKSYREFAEYMEDKIYDNENNTIRSIFISFDYQLDGEENYHHQPPSGKDCLFHTIVNAAEHPEIYFGIRGHSSDEDFNKEILEIWAREMVAFPIG